MHESHTFVAEGSNRLTISMVIGDNTYLLYFPSYWYKIVDIDLIHYLTKIYIFFSNYTLFLPLKQASKNVMACCINYLWTYIFFTLFIFLFSDSWFAQFSFKLQLSWEVGQVWYMIHDLGFYSQNITYFHNIWQWCLIH